MAFGLLGLAWVLPGAADTTTAPQPAGTHAPPTIYHVVVRPLCSKLHEQVAPAIGMILENDSTIEKSPQLFEQYNRAALTGVDNSASNGHGMMGGVPMTGDAANGTMNASQNMALLGMENLIRPLANNIIAIKKLLDSPQLMNTGNPDDDRRLAIIRARLEEAVKMQSRSLDIVSGFVDTQQMGDLQHSDEEYIAATSQSDTSETRSGLPTPQPLMQNPNQVGLPQDPYNVDLTTVPGLTLGYNPVTRLVDGLNWTIKQTASLENDASKSILDAAALCRQ